MAGRIGSVQRAQDGQSHGFVVYDAQDRACMYLGFSPGTMPIGQHEKRRGRW
jgi:hypothetical protein